MKVALSGCFDCLHAGHKHILKKAEVLSSMNGYRDQITIALNSDESIKILKGKDRPIEDFDKRKRTLASFVSRCSNFNIVKFSTEEELLAIYRTAQPIFIIHGNDIKDTSKITGIEEFNIILIPRLPNISTTQIIEANKCN